MSLQPIEIFHYTTLFEKFQNTTLFEKIPKYHTVRTIPKCHTVRILPKYHTVGTIPKSNIKIVKSGKVDTPNTQLHDHSLCMGTSIKSGGVKIILWAQISSRYTDSDYPFGIFKLILVK